MANAEIRLHGIWPSATIFCGSRSGSSASRPGVIVAADGVLYVLEPEQISGVSELGGDRPGMSPVGVQKLLLKP